MPLNLDQCIEQLYRGEILAEPLVREICERLKEHLLFESNVHMIKSPVTVVGDVHGQFYDLLELFKVGGKPPNTNYLFLGDYVDRGLHSVETISLLACLKLRYPDRITLLRGNHECRTITQTYGFYGECRRKYGNPNVWKYFTELFDYLTIAALIDNKIYAIHGGLSPAIITIDQVRTIDRFQEIPFEGPLTDIMWSDPEPERDGFIQSQRGAGYLFGGDVLNQFMQINGLEHVTRAHQLAMEGYQTLFQNKLSTVWSAPNYCYRCGNVAAILEVSEQRGLFFNTFSAAPESHPSNQPKDIPDYFV